jgi:hypothetical protein
VPYQWPLSAAPLQTREVRSLTSAREPLSGRFPWGCSPACALHGLQESVLRQRSEYQTRAIGSPLASARIPEETRILRASLDRPDTCLQTSAFRQSAACPPWIPRHDFKDLRTTASF